MEVVLLMLVGLVCFGALIFAVTYDLARWKF